MSPLKIRARLAQDFPEWRFKFALFDCDTQIALVATKGRLRRGVALLDNAEAALRAWLADQENPAAGESGVAVKPTETGCSYTTR